MAKELGLIVPNPGEKPVRFEQHKHRLAELGVTSLARSDRNLSTLRPGALTTIARPVSPLRQRPHSAACPASFNHAQKRNTHE